MSDLRNTMRPTYPLRVKEATPEMAQIEDANGTVILYVSANTFYGYASEYVESIVSLINENPEKFQQLMWRPGT